METLTPKRTNGSTDEPNIVLTRESIFLDCWCLTPLSAIFQLYHGDQF
jgi:hypothetical protein